MRIPKKKSRRIVVGGTQFLWMLKGRSRYKGNAPMVLQLIVQEEAEQPGVPLNTYLISKAADETKELSLDDFERYNQHKSSLLPSDVAKIIQAGITKGWNPSQKGSIMFEFEDELELNGYRIIVPKQ